jgi:isopropylmalate/homocitrate/citramalate synthase
VPREYGDGWYVSWRNFDDASPAPGSTFAFHDTTLRDGEQQAGLLFAVDEKVEIARALDRLGVDRIEAGMVAVSEDDRTAVRRIAELGLDAEVWTIIRSIPKDVRYAIDCGVHGAGVIILANEQYCEIFRWTVDEALEKAVAAADLARSAGLVTTLIVADSSRMTEERLAHIVTTGSESGCFDAVGIMDTFGTLSPRGAHALVSAVRELTDLPIEFHPHNDFGLGTANALAGLEAGAATIHTSVLGLGERVGNTSLEELALAAPLLYGFEHQLDLGRITEVAELVQRHSRMHVAPNKPIVGTSYSQIESGTIASEFVRWTAEGRDLQWLFPFVPALIGGPEVELVIGKGAGLANVDAALAAAGIELDDAAKRELLVAAKEQAAELHRALTRDEFAQVARAAAADGRAAHA